MFTTTTETPIQSMYAPVYEKIDQMRKEYKAARLATLNRKMMAGLITPKEMLERELLAE